LWLYRAGFHGNWPGYRIPSIAAGVGSVVLAGLIGLRRNAPAACFAMMLVAFSYVQILYSSEARGYAEVVFFSFLSYYALDKYLEKRAWPAARRTRVVHCPQGILCGRRASGNAHLRRRRPRLRFCQNIPNRAAVRAALVRLSQRGKMSRPHPARAPVTNQG
jgi:hypothetical protein